MPRILVLFGSVAFFGAERGNLEALMALKSQGAEILCLICDEEWSKDVPAALDARGLTWRKVPYIQLGRGAGWYSLLFRNSYRFILSNWAFMRAWWSFRPTHVHAYGEPYVANFMPALMLVRTPLVYRAGDEPTLHNWVRRMIWRFVVRRTKSFVAISNFVASALQRNGVFRDRINIIYNAPTTRLGLSDFPADLYQAGSIAVYLGQICEHKGVHLLVAAFTRLLGEFPDAHLVIAGRIHPTWEGDAWGRGLKSQVLNDPSVTNRVHFLGSIEDVPALLNRCSFLVVPSLFAEPLGNVVMEAKQAGRPAIGFPRGGIPELIEHGVDGLVCPEPTAEALTNALRTYLAAPDLALTHGAAARASLVRLGIPQFGQKWRDVYVAAKAADAAS